MGRSPGRTCAQTAAHVGLLRAAQCQGLFRLFVVGEAAGFDDRRIRRESGSSHPLPPASGWVGVRVRAPASHAMHAWLLSGSWGFLQRGGLLLGRGFFGRRSSGRLFGSGGFLLRWWGLAFVGWGLFLFGGLTLAWLVRKISKSELPSGRLGAHAAFALTAALLTPWGRHTSGQDGHLPPRHEAREPAARRQEQPHQGRSLPPISRDLRLTSRAAAPRRSPTRGGAATT